MASNEKSLQSAESSSLIKQINFKFLCMLSAWHLILQETEKVNKSLQSKTMNIHKAACLIEGLSLTLQQMRNNIFESIFDDCKM